MIRVQGTGKEILAHGDSTDMPDPMGTNKDHDYRYTKSTRGYAGNPFTAKNINPDYITTFDDADWTAVVGTIADDTTYSIAGDNSLKATGGENSTVPIRIYSNVNKNFFRHSFRFRYYVEEDQNTDYDGSGVNIHFDKGTNLANRYTFNFMPTREGIWHTVEFCTSQCAKIGTIDWETDDIVRIWVDVKGDTSGGVPVPIVHFDLFESYPNTTDKAAIGIMYDDQLLGAYLNGIKPAMERGIKTMLAVNPLNVGTTSYMTWLQIKECYDSDMVLITNHYDFFPTIPGTTITDQINYLRDGKDLLLDQGIRGFGIEHYTIPSGTDGTSTNTLSATHFETMFNYNTQVRGTREIWSGAPDQIGSASNPGTVMPRHPRNPKWTWGVFTTDDTVGTEGGADTTKLLDDGGLLDRVIKNRDFIPLWTHNVGDDPINNISTANMLAILDRIKTEVDAGVLEVITYEDLFQDPVPNYLLLDGSNADKAINIGSQNFTTTGTVYTGSILAGTDTSGVLTLGGIGGTYDENLTFDFDYYTNEVYLSSSSGTNRLIFGIMFQVEDDTDILLGGGNDVALRYNVTQAKDSLQLGLTVGNNDFSGYFSIMEKVDIGHANRAPLATTANPTLRIYSSDETVATDYIEFFHDQSTATIQSGDGAISFAGDDLTTTGVGTVGTGIITGGLTVNNGVVAQNHLTLKGYSVGEAGRGGSIGWWKNGSTSVSGYTYNNINNRFVWDTTAQSTWTDTGNAWISFDNGSASFAGHALTIGSTGILATTGAIDTPEISNTLDDLKLQPDVQGDIVCFGDTDVDNASHGKRFEVWRKAAEGDSSLYMYMGSNAIQANLNTSAALFYMGAGNTGVGFWTSSSFGFLNDKTLSIGSSSSKNMNISLKTNQTNDAPLIGLEQDINTLIICEKEDMSFNFAHPIQLNPTLFIHSKNQSTTEWLSLTHSDTNGVIATGAGDLDISCPANKTLELQTAVYKDINMAGYLLAKPASNFPTVDSFVDENGDDTAIETYAFAIGKKVHGGFELQHDYKEGTNLVFHVHWQGILAPSGIDNVQWRLNYIVTRDGTTLNAAVVIDSPDSAIDTQYESNKADFAAIDGTNFKMEDQFMFTLTRVAATGDVYLGDALIETAGIHYQVDTLGSRQITAK